MSTAASGLRELHLLHIRLCDREDKLVRGPKQLAARSRYAENKLAELDAQKARIIEFKKSADQKQLQLKSNESKIVELTTKLNSAASNREFDILKSHIEADTMANSVLEDEILEAMEKVDQAQLTLQEAKQDHQAAQTEESRIGSEIAAAEPILRKEAEELEVQVKDAEKTLPGEVALVYRRLLQAHGSGALAAVENGACSACFSLLSPQHKVELNTGKILFCKSCGRLIYKHDEE